MILKTTPKQYDDILYSVEEYSRGKWFSGSPLSFTRIKPDISKYDKPCRVVTYQVEYTAECVEYNDACDDPNLDEY